MRTISNIEARSSLDSLIQVVNRDREPVTIHGDDELSVVVIASDDYASMEETLHLYSTPANTARIRQGLADFHAGKFQTGELCN